MVGMEQKEKETGDDTLLKASHSNQFGWNGEHIIPYSFMDAPFNHKVNWENVCNGIDNVVNI